MPSQDPPPDMGKENPQSVAGTESWLSDLMGQ